MVNNVRVFEADISTLTVGAFAPLLRARGVVGAAAQARIARQAREGLRLALFNTARNAVRDGGFIRSGRAQRTMLSGVRAFGSNLANIRGHIIGPSYAEAHERGATITPKRARALALPLAPAQRADGTPKLPSPRSWQNILPTFIYRSARTGQSYIAYRNQGGQLVLLYVLVDSVQLSKYSGFISRAWEDQKEIVLIALGNAMLTEFALVDFVSLMGISSKYRRGGRTGRRR